ncbi:MAG TPA: VOC family protein [Alphaproteobacteria bacterium]
MPLVAIDHVQLAMPAGGEARARTFYEGILGIPEVPKPAELAKRGGAWFEHHGIKVHLGVDPNFIPAKKAHPGFIVDDLDELIERLGNAGHQAAVEATEDGRRAFVHDPFGNRIELIAPVRPTA